MADYYTHFSLVLDLPDVAARKYALDLAREAADMRFDDQQDLRADFPASLVDVLELWLFETDTDHEPGHHGIWLHSSDGGVDAACAFIQHLLERFNPGACVGFEWSNDCSKPRTDAYGGGAAFITADETRYTTTAEWLQEQTNCREQSQGSISGSQTK